MARTIMQIKQEWNKAKTKAEKDKLHAEADRIRNYVTTTKYDKNNTPYQAVVSTKLPPLPKAAPKKAPLTPATFRNATPQLTVTPEQQAKNQALALQELTGKDKNIASVARGFAGGMLDPFGLRNLTKLGANPAQEQASAKNVFTVSAIKNPRQVAQGLTPVQTVSATPKFETLGEFAGSTIGVDPLGIGLTKGVQKGVQIAKGLKSVEKVPVIVNGKVTFANVPKQAAETASKNILAPTPRIVPTKTTEVAPTIKTEIPTTQHITPIKAQNVAVQPQISNLQPTIQPEIKNVQTANLPTGKVEQKMKDLGADVNQFNTPQKTSRVATNTFKNSTMFNEAEKELLNNKDYAYDPVTEVQSLAQAKQRLDDLFFDYIISRRYLLVVNLYYILGIELHLMFVRIIFILFFNFGNLI